MSPESFIGSISKFAGYKHFIPYGWASCDGQTIDVKNNQALYAVIGNNYGGIFGQNFKLPNLNEGKKEGEPFYVICMIGSFPSPQ